MINSLSKLIYKMEKDIIYKLIKYCNLELCIDVGAAKGSFTTLISSASKDKANIFSYEPFYGNHDFFYEETKDLNNVTLIKKALSDKVGKEKLFVHSKVIGTEKGWENYKGYSSVGMLSSISKLDFSKYPQGEHLDIDCTTLDIEFKDKHIDFVKIDVQGAEINVLKGAENLLKQSNIDLLYIEWSGEKEVIDILNKNNYTIYDSTYLIVPNNNDISLILENNFELIEELKLSTGKIAYEASLKNKDLSPIEIISQLRNQNLAYIQTDLIAVSKKFNKRFLKIISNYNSKNEK